MNDTVYYIFHVERTGGTTLRHILQDHYGWDTGIVYPHYFVYQKKPGLIPFVVNEEVAKARFIIGHAVYYGIHEVLGKPYHYVVFLRDPMIRMLSWYNHTRVEDMKHGNYSTNFDAWFKFRKVGTQIWSLLRPNASSLEKAKEILTKTSFIGLQETFEEDTNQLFYPKEYKENLNTTSKRMAQVRGTAVQFSEGEAAMVRSVLDDDYQLYDFAKQLRETGHNKGFQLPPQIV